MEDEGMKALERPFPNSESEEKVDHYHAHGKNCEDMGHHLENGEHSLPHEDNAKDEENKGEHGYPKEDDEKDKENGGDGKYPGMIRKIR